MIDEIEQILSQSGPTPRAMPDLAAAIRLMAARIAELEASPIGEMAKAPNKFPSLTTE